MIILFHYNKIKEFEAFMYEHVGKNIKTETFTMTGHIYTLAIDKVVIPKLIDFFVKYDLPYKEISKQELQAVFKDEFFDESYVGIKYLSQYIDNEKNARNNYKMKEKLWSLLWEVPNHKEASRSVGSYNKDEFDEIVLGQRISHFVVDRIFEEDVRNIVKHVLGVKIEVEHLNIVKKEFDIDGLICFRINQFTDAYSILCLLWKSKINHCIFADVGGKVSIGIEMREKPLRVSAVKFRDDLNEVFLSSWEANFARFLNHLGISWLYEHESFLLGEDYYFPDFFLGNNILVEIKGFWNATSRSKVFQFKEKHKEYKLFTIDVDMFCTINKLYKDIIDNWEHCTISKKAERIPVVGINVAERMQSVSQLSINDEVFLCRDSGNQYDKNAIKVLNKDGGQIGFIAKDWASIYADKLDIGMTYNSTIKKIDSKVIYLSVKRNNDDEDLLYDFVTAREF